MATDKEFIVFREGVLAQHRTFCKNMEFGRREFQTLKADNVRQYSQIVIFFLSLTLSERDYIYILLHMCSKRQCTKTAIFKKQIKLKQKTRLNGACSTYKNNTKQNVKLHEENLIN